METVPPVANPTSDCSYDGNTAIPPFRDSNSKRGVRPYQSLILLAGAYFFCKNLWSQATGGIFYVLDTTTNQTVTGAINNLTRRAGEPHPPWWGENSLAIRNEQTFTKDEASFNLSSIPDRVITYLHVGKTGGTTLNSVLRSNCEWMNLAFAKKQCFENLHGNSRISNLTRTSIHCGMRPKNRNWYKRSNSFLVTLRNPISRLVSAFNFEHPKNNNNKGKGVRKSFYGNCYDTFPNLVNDLVAKNKTDCVREATELLRGNNASIHLNPHIVWNNRFYANFIPDLNTSEILVLRTEHLWSDWRSLDRLLGGPGAMPLEDNSTLAVESHGSESFQVTSGTEEMLEGGLQWLTLCCVVYDELVVYQTLVFRAVNLKPSEMEDTLAVLYRQCGISLPVSDDTQAGNHQWRRKQYVERLAVWSAEHCLEG